ncbi:MAG TPA: hypothetical protein PKD73_09440 [Burkholderiaceae bacterium]|nr:hypothetical protein [Burkholderiaceae bacterium]
MKHILQAGLIGIVLATSGAAALAETKRELAVKLVTLQQADYESLGREIAANTAQRLLQAVLPAVDGLPADKREAAARDVQAEIKKFFDGVEPMLKTAAAKSSQAVVPPLLEEKFSEDELKQIIAWVDSPLSRKYRQFTVELPDKVMEKTVADTKAQMDPKFKALDQTLMKRLGITPGSGAGGGTGGKSPKK